MEWPTSIGRRRFSQNLVTSKLNMKVILKIKKIFLYFCLPYLNLCYGNLAIKENKNKNCSNSDY
jgi:hypothetical protein